MLAKKRLCSIVRDLVRNHAETTDTEREHMKYRQDLEAKIKECTAQLTIAKEQSKAADIAKSIYLSHMSHELRTPLNAIFAFFYSDRTDKTAQTGTGLGLTISRNFARLMGGDILTASRRGKGAHFTRHITVELASKPADKIHYQVKRKKNQHLPPPPAPHHCLKALAELPASILEQLKESSLALDMEKINICIDDILAGNPDRGESLKSLAKRFRFNEVSKLADETIQIKT